MNPNSETADTDSAAKIAFDFLPLDHIRHKKKLEDRINQHKLEWLESILPEKRPSRIGTPFASADVAFNYALNQVRANAKGASHGE